MDRELKIEKLARHICRARGDNPDDKVLLEEKRTALGNLCLGGSWMYAWAAIPTVGRGSARIFRRRGNGAMTKRILRKFTIDEISIVDRPAQEHARAVIMKGDTTMEANEVDLQGLTHEACLLKAAELRKSEPKLTPEQAYAKVYESNIEIRRAHQAGRDRNFAKLYAPVARTEPAIGFGTEDALEKLKELAADLRRRVPYLSVEQAFARVFSDPSNRELATAERAQAYERMFGAGTRVVA
jgi:hypothetical protein